MSDERRPDLSLLEKALTRLEQAPREYRGRSEIAFDEPMLPIEVDVVDLHDVDVSFRSRIEPDFLLIKEQGEVTL